MRDIRDDVAGRVSRRHLPRVALPARRGHAIVGGVTGQTVTSPDVESGSSRTRIRALHLVYAPGPSPIGMIPLESPSIAIGREPGPDVQLAVADSEISR